MTGAGTMGHTPVEGNPDETDIDVVNPLYQTSWQFVLRTLFQASPNFTGWPLVRVRERAQR